MTPVRQGEYKLLTTVAFVFSIVLAQTSTPSVAESTISNPVTPSNYSPKGTTSATNGDCEVTLANNMTYATIKTLFKGASGNGKRAVYITLKVAGDPGTTPRPFDVRGNDTFAPDQWVWATPKGKNLLRMPLDYVILSLGILSIGTANFDIVFNESTVDCLKSRNVPYERTIHILTKFLAENVSGNGTTVEKDSDNPVICRSAYAFTHRIFVDLGVGYKCCEAPDPSVRTGTYRCATPYTLSWELVWYGPVVLLCWVYAIFLLHFYKLYRRSFNLKRMRELSGLRKTLQEIKSDVTGRIVRMSKDFARIGNPDELMALREDPGFLDVLGVDKPRQSRITSAARVLLTLFLFAAYYTACGVFLHEYRRQLEMTFRYLTDSGAIYLNVLGHLGWVFCDLSLGLTRYAVFELVYTLLMPFFAAMAYFSMSYRQDALDFSASKKRAQEEETHRRVLTTVNIHKIFSPAVTGAKRMFLRFVTSGCGKVLQGISLVLFFVYVVFVAGVFLTYVVYFVGLGVFANIDVISPYIIPMVVCFAFFAHSFSPAYYQYRVIKDTVFTVCLERESRLLIKREKEIFLKREIVENFYVPNSRTTVYNCFLRILVVVAFMLLVILVILTLQFPYYFKMDSIVAFLGVQVVFFLPLLSGLVSNTNNQLSALEQNILQRDIKAYVERYEEEHPEMPATVEEANGVVRPIPGGSEDSAVENDYGNHELGELGFGSPIADRDIKSA